MGICTSCARDEVDVTPCCHTCGETADRPWSRLTQARREAWTLKNGQFTCRRCGLDERLQTRRFAKEREFYAQAKAALYPKRPFHQRLHKIPSSETWAAGDSFKRSWRPPSSLAELMRSLSWNRKAQQQAKREQQEGAGDEPGPSDAGAGADAATPPGCGHSSGGPPSPAGSGCSGGGRGSSPLGSLSEGIEAAEEASLASSAEGEAERKAETAGGNGEGGAAGGLQPGCGDAGGEGRPLPPPGRGPLLAGAVAARKLSV